MPHIGHRHTQGRTARESDTSRSSARSTEHDPIFIGDVTKQSLVTDDDAELLRVNSVTFHAGARNRLHHHAADQVLVITDGFGIVATETEAHEVSAGDVVLVPAGERHWHGARPGATMTHLSYSDPWPTHDR